MSLDPKVRSNPIPRRLATSAEIPPDWFAPSKEPNPFAAVETEMHRYGKNGAILCCTEKRGYPQPDNVSISELVLDASDGFIPLWLAGRTLHYRFDEKSNLKSLYEKVWSGKLLRINQTPIVQVKSYHDLL
jgi:hypothetical protein